MKPSARATPEATPTLAACVLLAGGPRPSPLALETGCSVLDLTLTPTRTVLGVWIERLTELCPLSGPRLEVRIVHDERTPEPIVVSDPGPLEVRIDRERRSYRGPAGITRDECADLDESDRVLVVEAGRLAGCSLRPLLMDHAQTGADVTIGANPDGSTSGIYVVRVGSLSLVPKNGFMDLKEQWLQKALGAGLDLRVHRFPEPGVISLRTREQFLGAARRLNGFSDPMQSITEWPDASEPGGGDDRSVLARTSTIAPGAVVLDSVVMDHATIAAGAVVVRSLVCPRAVVGPDEVVVDGFVTRNGVGLSVGKGILTRLGRDSSRSGDGQAG